VDDTPPAAGKSDSASVTCMKTIGAQARIYATAVYDRLRGCLNAVQEYNARVAASLPASQIDAALNTARKQCVEPKATAPDSKTMLGKLETAHLKAVSAIEKKCGTPGDTALDGKTIGNSASADFTPPRSRRTWRGPAARPRSCSAGATPRPPPTCTTSAPATARAGRRSTLTSAAWAAPTCRRWTTARARRGRRTRPA
jgi:hypothetical protein